MTDADLLSHIRAAARRTGSGPGVRFLGYGSPDVAFPYEKFLLMSAWLGQKIPEPAPGRPQTLVIAANSPMATLLAFFAGLVTGSRPLVLPGPTAAGGTEAFLHTMRQTLTRFPGSCVLALEEGLIPDSDVMSGVPVLPLPTDASAYGTAEFETLARRPPARGDHVAFLQMTSASTGDSKLVAISHANACANLTALRQGLGAGTDERMATWLPLNHDMGLAGTALLSFFSGWPLHMMKPSEFILRPHRWIEALSRFRCTITAAPNFGYDYARSKVRDQDIEGCDLSALRRAVVGAEPIRLDTMRGFQIRFRGYGLGADSLVPSYGMAETTVGTAMVRPGRPLRYLHVDIARTDTGQPTRILAEGSLDTTPPAPSASPTDPRGVPVFSVGPPLPGIEVTLVDDDCRPLGKEGVLGEIVVSGPSVSVGYLDHDTSRPIPFPDGAHHTGDLGLRHQGELFILERRKHVIIRHGRNYLASLLEERVAHILDRPAHEILVLDTDIHDPASDIAAIIENFPGPACLSTGQEVAFKELDLPIDALLFSRKRAIPRTTSGKKQYDRARRLRAEHTLPIDQVLRLTSAHESHW